MTAVLSVTLGLALATPAVAAGPAALSEEHAAAAIDSKRGSGSFGSWFTDGFGLPAYRYDIDHRTAPQAVQPELSGKREAWHQLGNDHVNAVSFNRGYTQLWSQDRRYEFTNQFEPGARHYTGGYGFLRLDGQTYSTAYDDRPAGAGTKRVFGTGYFQQVNDLAGVNVDEHVYAPYGDDPLLLHDVVLKNTTDRERTATWFEYWDVNPVAPRVDNKAHLGLGRPAWDPEDKSLSVAQLPDNEDTDPLSIFAAAVQGPVEGFETSASAFFGAVSDGAHPAGAAAPVAGNSIALPSAGAGAGDTTFVLRSPVRLAPGQSVTLRYAYGAAHQAAIAGLLKRQRAAADPLAASQKAWRQWVPHVELGDRPALARELQWSAYMFRSSTVYEEACGYHMVNQGGLYLYDFGVQAAFRDPLEYTRAMDYMDPALSRDIIRYSAHEQPQGSGQVPYAMRSMCNRDDFGFSTDLDLWLLLGSAEYGLSNHDPGFFDEKVTYSKDIGTDSLWDHLKLAFEHQESLKGSHGGYVTGATGDWADGATTQIQLSESTITPALAVFVYTRLAVLADLRGDKAFSTKLRDAAAADLKMVRGEWVDRGWYARGFSGERRIGTGAMFGEMQPWAILAGAPSDKQAKAIIDNYKRFLNGRDAPAAIKGPSKIGSSMSPATNDPDVTERTNGAQGVGDNNAVYLGGTWYVTNGYLVQALTKLDGVVPKINDFAFDEMQRNTLTAHADAFPNRWNGVLSVDDACNSFYATDPSQCGIGLATNVDLDRGGIVKSWNTQNMYQPFDLLLDTIHLSGVVPTAAGFEITPHLPLKDFDVRLPRFGLAAKPGELRGYVSGEASRELRMDVAVPEGVDAATVRSFAEGRVVSHRVQDGRVVFTLPVTKGKLADWAVTSSSGDGQPNTKACSSRRRFKIRIGPRRGRLMHAVVKVSGRRVAVRGGRRLTAVVDLRRTPRSTITVIITGRVGHRRYRQIRRYRLCSRRGTTKR